MPEKPRTASGKFERVLTDDQLTAIAVLLIEGRSQADISRELGLPKQSVSRVARMPETKTLVSEEKAKLAVKASNRRAEIALARAEGREPTPETPKSMVYDPEIGGLRPFQGGRILGVFAARDDGGVDTLYDAKHSTALTSYADDHDYARVPREPMPDATFIVLRDRSGSFSKLIEPGDATDIGNAIGLATDLYPKINPERLRTLLQAAEPGDVIVLPELPEHATEPGRSSLPGQDE